MRKGSKTFFEEFRNLNFAKQQEWSSFGDSRACTFGVRA